MLDIPATLQEKRHRRLPCRHNYPACGIPGSIASRRPNIARRPRSSPSCSTTTRPRRQYPPQVYHTHHLDVYLHADCLAAGKNQTVRRTRPFALRRASTFRPFLVLMRFRNPCSRLRLRFEGCLNVNDIADSFSRNHFSMKRPHYRGGARGCQSICSPGQRCGTARKGREVETDLPLLLAWGLITTRNS